MNLHEYQAKQLFAEYGIPVSRGIPARSAEDAAKAADEIGGSSWVVKAQVHAGGRGKAGGVKLTKTPEEVREAAAKMLGQRLVTHQTGPEGLPIGIVYVEAGSSIERELYLSLLVDRGRERIVVMASAAGGMDIEEVAAKTPEKILTVYVHPAAGLQPYQARQIAFGLELKGDQVGQFTKLLQNLYRLFVERDCGLLEVNPLIVNGEGKLHALDAKIGIEENALFRQSRLMEWRDPSQEDEMENRASAHGLNYVSLDGQIACMVNGAGLAMATMDLIKLHGGAPGQLPRRRRRRHGGAGVRGLQADSFQRERRGDPGEHLRRHRPLRPDRRGHHPGGQGSGREGAGGGAPRGHQRGAWPRAAREQRRGHHRGR
jgi:succinyl-CoA synthetase beta subunit